MNLTRESFYLHNPGSIGTLCLIAGFLGLGLSAIGYFVDAAQMFHSYLTAFVFWLSISLGGLFFTMLHHLTGANWSTVLRRLSESVMMVIPFMALLFIPVLLGMSELYHWTHEDIVAADELLQKKVAYLNTPFFIVRAAGFFAIWSITAWLLYRLSIKQDQEHTEGMPLTGRRISAAGMILFALTTTYASFDWLMSLDAHWYSTIFGVYVFSGSFLALLSFVILAALYMRRRGVLKDVITIEHYHDVGKLTFAFVIFWAYMAFSQYFIIWYGNIPEETVWFLHRWENEWRSISLLIIFGHFVLPFIVLLTRRSKRSLLVLTVMAFWILAMRWVDLHWLVLPNLHKHGPHFSWMDLSTVVGIGGLFLWRFWRLWSKRALVPVNDPGLETSIRFVNN